MSFGNGSAPLAKPPRGTPRGGSPRSLLLVSGSPAGTRTSFRRQLEHLARAFIRLGVRAEVTGAGEYWGLESPTGVKCPAGSKGRKPCDAIILLGYPDQFASLDAEAEAPPRGTDKAPRFLWAQFSRPPEPHPLGNYFLVPLTPATGMHLAASGLGNVTRPIPHGVDTRVFRPRSSAERAKVKRRLGFGEKFVVGTVGAHTARKRFDAILEAYALFAESRPDSLLLVKTDRAVSLDGGDLSRTAGRLGIGGKTVIVTDELGDAGMADIYASMDVYVNLSEWEGFCIPVAEAMASGVPVVAQPAQGPGEILPYRDLFAFDDEPSTENGTALYRARPEAAAEVLSKAADNPRLLASLGVRGRREALDRYDIVKVAGMWLGVIGERMGKARTGEV